MTATQVPLSGAAAALIGLAVLGVLWLAGTLTAVAAGGKWLIMRS